MKATRLMLSSILSLCSLIGYARVAAGDEPAIVPRAMEQVLPLAEKGGAKSENEVGVIFASGRGVPQDFHVKNNFVVAAFGPLKGLIRALTAHDAGPM